MQKKNNKEEAVKAFFLNVLSINTIKECMLKRFPDQGGVILSHSYRRDNEIV